MLAPTLETLPPEILSHIFSYLVSKDIATVPPSRSLSPYYQSIIYKSVFIVSASAYTSFNSALRAKPFLAKLIIKFDIDFRDEYFQRCIHTLTLVNNIGMMTQLKWLGLGEVPKSVIALLSAETLRDSLPKLRHLNISEEYATTTNRSALKLLSLMSQLSQVESLSIEIDCSAENVILRKPDAEEEKILSLYNFDHIKYLDMKGKLDHPFFIRLFQQFKKIRSLTLRTLDGLDLTPILQYSYLADLHLLDATLYGSDSGVVNQIILFTHLRELSIGDATLFPRESIPLLSNLSSLQTLNLGIEFWNHESASDDITPLLRPGSQKLKSLTNLNFNTRLDYSKVIAPGSRWKNRALDDSEFACWEWGKEIREDVAIFEEEDWMYIFQIAEENKIKIGGQILEVEWPKLGRPPVYEDI